MVDVCQKLSRKTIKGQYDYIINLLISGYKGLTSEEHSRYIEYNSKDHVKCPVDGLTKGLKIPVERIFNPSDIDVEDKLNKSNKYLVRGLFTSFCVGNKGISVNRR